MKQYVWIVAAWIVAAAVNAAENPFASSENLQKMESEQQVLLKELEREAAALEVVRDTRGEVKKKKEEQEIPPVAQPEEGEKPAASQRSVSPEPEAAPKKDEESEPPQEIVRIEKIKEDQAKLDAAREAQDKARTEEKRRAAEEKAKRKHEAEARLRAERKAAQKRAEEAEQARLKAEKERLKKQARLKVEKERTKERPKAGSVKADKRAVSAKDDIDTIDIDDINITREKIEAKRKADKELQRAIMEMDQED